MRARVALLLAAAALGAGACGGGDGDDDKAKSEEPAKSEIVRDPAAQKLLRNALDTYRRGKTEMIASLRADLSQDDTATLIDDLWDLRNEIYQFDQALRRIEFERGAQNRVNTILENNRATIALIDPILDAKKPPPNTREAVQRAIDDSESIESQAQDLVGRL